MGVLERGFKLPPDADSRSSIPMPLALLFDMDGTLTEPMLDFPQIKAEMGIGDRPILEALAEMPTHQRHTAEAVLHRHEERAANESRLNSGCDELIAWVRTRNLRTALITRNSRRSAACVLRRHGLDFDVLITREDGKFKPDPTPVLLACQKLQVAPADAWMIGDGRYDVEAGAAACVRTVWISHGRERDFETIPSEVVSDLHELLKLFEKCANILR